MWWLQQTYQPVALVRYLFWPNILDYNDENCNPPRDFYQTATRNQVIE